MNYEVFHSGYWEYALFSQCELWALFPLIIWVALSLALGSFP